MKCNIICKFASEKDSLMAVITEEKIQRFNHLVEKAEKIVISAHVHADGDAVGSTSALFHYLTEVRGKSTSVVLADRDAGGSSFLIPEDDKNHFTFYWNNPGEAARIIAGADLVILLDCNSFSRTEDLCEFFTESYAPRVLIDHHLDPQENEFELVFSQTDTSSASELLFYLLMAMPDIAGDARKLPRQSGIALMTGMTTDTNNFSNSVYPSTLEMASLLLAAGVDRDAILSDIYQNYRENRLRAMGFLLSKMTITPEGAAYMILTRKNMITFDIAEGETEGFVNLPLAVKNVRMSVFLRQDNGFFRVSVRSKKGTSAQRFAATYFNGGGHENAAGGKLFFSDVISSVKDVVSYLENALNEFLHE